ncbi:hypothetical protein [Serratia symbiotica]|uniref:hypothetical protein n=1 Tax=Serratia symbiotica TaxID=138074 RepID=UPI0034643C5B
MFDLISHLTEKGIQHTVSDNGHVTVGGDLYLGGTGITALPDNLSVGGSLDLRDTSITALPDNLSIGDWLDLSGTSITALPDGLTVGGSLYLSDTSITALPDNLSVGGSLNLRDTSITALPDNLSVGGSLNLSDTRITALPDNVCCRSLYLDPERISNIAYRKGCGRSDRTIFAAWTGKEICIAAGCFFDTLDAFERAVDVKYTGKAADDYKQAARECVAELTEKLGK